MIVTGKCYRDNNHNLISIGDVTEDYPDYMWGLNNALVGPPENPDIWNWYDRETGAFVAYTTKRGQFCLPNARCSIEDHTEYDSATGLKTSTPRT